MVSFKSSVNLFVSFVKPRNTVSVVSGLKFSILQMYPFMCLSLLHISDLELEDLQWNVYYIGSWGIICQNMSPWYIQYFTCCTERFRFFLETCIQGILVMHVCKFFSMNELTVQCDPAASQLSTFRKRAVQKCGTSKADLVCFINRYSRYWYYR